MLRFGKAWLGRVRLGVVRWGWVRMQLFICGEVC